MGECSHPHSSPRNSNAGIFKLSTELPFTQNIVIILYILVWIPEGFVLLEMEYDYLHNWWGLFHQLHHHCFVINRRFIRASLSQYLRIQLWYQIGPRTLAHTNTRKLWQRGQHLLDLVQQGYQILWLLVKCAWFVNPTKESSLNVYRCY